MQQPPYHQLTTQPTVHPMATDTLPPVPAQIRQKIIQGEFIDFSVLLHRATFLDATADPLPSTQQPIKKISSFVMWMQAWNLYLLVILSHNPAKVLEMIPYQRLICSATTLLPLKSWLQYYAKFCTLAAANPLLRWDQRHPNLWLECLALGNKEQQRWPCPYCKATTHFPENCPQSLFVITNQLLHHLSLKDPFHQYVVSSTKVTAPEPLVSTDTSACPVKATTLESAASKTRTDLSGNDNPASSRSLDIECDNVDRQLHIYCRPQG